MSERKTFIDILTEIDLGLAHEMLRAYHAAFAPLAALSPVRQVFTDSDFLAGVCSATTLKFLVRDRAGAICGLATLTNDLSTQPWLSPEYYHARYPKQMAESRLYYVGCLMVMPDHQHGPWAHLLLSSLVRWLADRQAIATFDCCAYNVDQVALPRLIEVLLQRGPTGKLVELDRQYIYAVVLDGSDQSG